MLLSVAAASPLSLYCLLSDRFLGGLNHFPIYPMVNAVLILVSNVSEWLLALSNLTCGEDGWPALSTLHSNICIILYFLITIQF